MISENQTQCSGSQVNKCFVEYTHDRYGQELATIREVEVAEQAQEFQGHDLSSFEDSKMEVLELRYNELDDLDSRREELVEEIQALTNVNCFDQYKLLNSECKEGSNE